MAFQPHHPAPEALAKPLPQLSREEILHKFDQLQQDLPELQNYAHSPGLAVLFDEIGNASDAIKFLEKGFSDLWIPMPATGLPLGLNPSVFWRFRRQQPRFLSDEFLVDPSAPPQHYHISKEALDPSYSIPQSLKYDELLGSGGAADVARVQCASGNAYALKCIHRKKDFSESKEQMQYIKMELDILKKIENRHYIRLVGSYTEEDHIGILLDPVADCNLEEYLEGFDHTPRSVRQLAGFFGCLASALACLHYKWQIRHKDIKPQNILVHNGNVLFTDFGISLDWSDSGSTTTRQEQARSPIYCAPETAEDKKRNSRTDVWSLGCVFLEMESTIMGKGWRYPRDTFKAYGPENYRNSRAGIEEVIKTLKESGSSGSAKGIAPLEWVEMMLQPQKEDRPTSLELRHMILDSRSQGGVSFCGRCCSGDISFEPVNSDIPRSYQGTTATKNSEDLVGWFLKGYPSCEMEPGTMADSEQFTSDKQPTSRGAPDRPLRVEIFNPRGCSWHGVEVEVDFSASRSLMTVPLICLYSLETWSAGEAIKVDFQGKSLESTRACEVILKNAKSGCQKHEMQCLVAPQEMTSLSLLAGQDLQAFFH